MSFHIVDTRISWLVAERPPASGEVLVIPANDLLWMGSGPGLELKKERGKEFELEAVRQGPIAPGEIAVTSGEPIGYRFLFHAVVMGQDLHWIEGAGRKAVAGILRRATAEKVKTIHSFPLYRGTHGDRAAAAREMLGAYLQILEQGSPIEHIHVLVADEQERSLLQGLFLQLLRGEAS